MFGRNREERPSKQRYGKNQTSSQAKVVKPTETQVTLQHVDETIETLDARCELLQHKMERELANAKKYMAANNKTQALRCMKRKRMYEEQLGRLEGQRMNMETMKMTVEDTAMTVQVIQAQRVVGSSMEKQNQKINVDKVDEDMERLQEAIAQQTEISEQLGQPLDNMGMDEDELLDELDELMGEDALGGDVHASAPMKSELSLGPTVPKQELPERQHTKPVAAKQNDKELLAALEAELNM